MELERPSAQADKGSSDPGRSDALTFWSKHAADGRCSEPQIYTGWSATGLMIIPGEREIL